MTDQTNDPAADSFPPRQRDMVDDIADACQKQGITREVGPEFYARFAALDDDALAEMIFDLVRHQSGFLKKKKGDPVANAVDFVTNMLGLVASGNLGFDEYGRMVFFRPDGPEPTLEMWKRMDRRINRAKPLIHAIARKVLS